MALQVAALGSVALAKEQLREWLAAGKVPWFCLWWKGLNAEDLAELKQERDGLFAFSSRLFTSAFAPSAAYCPGDPEFWNAGLKIDWEDDGAYELARLDGAQALGIKVSRAHVQALLPAEPSKPDEARGAGAWISATEARRMKKAGEIHRASELRTLLASSQVGCARLLPAIVLFIRSKRLTSRIRSATGPLAGISH